METENVVFNTSFVSEEAEELFKKQLEIEQEVCVYKMYILLICFILI